MAQIFTLPPARPLTSSGGAMPLARLYFYQTATSTPQNTYQDADLSTPHTNPVIADAYGAFAPVFLDPTLPAYRVKLTDSTGAQIWQYDGIPSNQNTAQQFRLISTAPGLLFGGCVVDRLQRKSLLVSVAAVLGMRAPQALLLAPKKYTVKNLVISVPD